MLDRERSGLLVYTYAWGVVVFVCGKNKKNEKVLSYLTLL